MEYQDWVNAVFGNLSATGVLGNQALDFIREHKVKLGFRRQGVGTSAMWWLDGGIYLNPSKYSPLSPADDPALLSLIVHEVRHLQHGFFTALSVFGELDAWQMGYRLFRELTDRYPHQILEQICSLPLCYDREVLRSARMLMQAYAGRKYRVDLLPLYPLPKEFCWWLKRQAPGEWPPG